MRLGSKVVLDYEPNKPMKFSCQALGCDVSNCKHILDVLDKHGDSEAILGAIGNLGKSVCEVDVLLLSNPHVWVPAWITDDGHGETLGVFTVNFPVGFWNPTAKKNISRYMAFSRATFADSEELCQISEGDGVVSISKVLVDVFKAAYLDFELKDHCRCKSRSHGMVEQRALDSRLRLKGQAKISELMRLYVTNKCSMCASRKVDMSGSVPEFK